MEKIKIPVAYKVNSSSNSRLRIKMQICRKLRYCTPIEVLFSTISVLKSSETSFCSTAYLFKSVKHKFKKTKLSTYLAAFSIFAMCLVRTEPQTFLERDTAMLQLLFYSIRRSNLLEPIFHEGFKFVLHM